MLATGQHALDLAVGGAPLKDVLEALAEAARQQAGDGASAAIFLADRGG